GRSGVGIAVRKGARKPDIGSLEALTCSLLAAESVAHSRMGASGLYFAELLERLGLADKLKKRVIVDKGPVAARVASCDGGLGGLTPAAGRRAREDPLVQAGDLLAGAARERSVDPARQHRVHLDVVLRPGAGERARELYDAALARAVGPGERGAEERHHRADV